MIGLTKRQQQVIDFIRAYQHENGVPPSLREIADHFGFASMTAAADHVRALRKKGFLETPTERRARALRVVSPLQPLRKQVVDIPVYGAIPAGLAEDRRQEAKGCVSIDVGTLGITPTPQTFALEVHGDSMIGRHIIDGDVVIVEHGRSPKPGDVVAALIDNESTLKTYMREKGKTWLRAENSRYPKLIPANELLIQGVMVGLIRKRKSK